MGDLTDILMSLNYTYKIEEKSNVDWVHFELVEKELIIHALEQAIEKNKFTTEDENYLQDELYVNHTLDEFPTYVDGNNQVVNLLGLEFTEGEDEVRGIPNLKENVREELNEILDWILKLYVSPGQGDRDKPSNDVLAHCQNLQQKLNAVVDSVEKLSLKQKQAEKIVLKGLDYTMEEISNIINKEINFSAEGASKFNKKIIQKIYQDGNTVDDLIKLKDNLEKKYEEFSARCSINAKDIELYEQLDGPEFQSLIDEYKSIKKEIILKDGAITAMKEQYSHKQF